MIALNHVRGIVKLLDVTPRASVCVVEKEPNDQAALWDVLAEADNVSDRLFPMTIDVGLTTAVETLVVSV